VLELKESRAWRWRVRKHGDRLVDHASGGHAVHGLLPEEQTAIVALFEQWGEVDRSHRKLAHRGSYLGLVWVSPSTVKRVLAAQGLYLKGPRRIGTSARRPFPEWATYTKNSIWIYDATHFQHCKSASVVAIMDLVTRKWLTTVVSAEETSTQIQVAFIEALGDEGLLDLIEARADGTVDLSLDDPFRPILLAVSDNGPQMTCGSTREFMALCAIAQHFGRPGTPTDQAWIESLFSHVKGEWSHLDLIKDPEVLRAELELVRQEYNGTRLHASLGYVTPDDEHEGRGPAIRRARKEGLAAARARRIDYHRQQRQPQPLGSPDVD
jgi:putative transposase